jgi:hypothetical protein
MLCYPLSIISYIPRVFENYVCYWIFYKDMDDKLM